jgi:hypothetical protein
LETIHALGVRLLGSLPPAQQALAQQQRFGKDRGPTVGPAASLTHASAAAGEAGGSGTPSTLPAWKQELADASYLLLIGVGV